MENITNFKGHRNAVLTLIIPPNQSLSGHLDSIQNRVKMIRHKKKRFQINRVLYYIREQTSDTKTFTGSGAVICCGYNLLNKPTYHVLIPPTEIEEFEYYYDSCFHEERIRELFYADIIVNLEPESAERKVDEILGHITDNDHLIALGEHELKLSFESNIVQELYITDDTLTQELVDLIRESNGKIMKIRSDRLSQHGQRLALLRYPVDFTTFELKKEVKEEVIEEVKDNE